MYVPIWLIFVVAVIAISALIFGGIAWLAAHTAPKNP